jgi:alpha-D-xyloside xylohydrolase
MPYIYALAGSVYFDDYTIMRALIMDFPNDEKVWNLGNQFMFGSSILVTPVTQYKARTWPVYLPKHEAGWYDFHSGKQYAGAQTIVADAPIEQMPLFVKAGSIIPAGPNIQYTVEKQADPITLYVYTGANASIDLYNDEAINYNYQKGKFEKIKITYDETSKTLTIGERQGTYEGALNERTFEIVWIDKNKPVGISLTTKPDQVIKYVGNMITINR